MTKEELKIRALVERIGEMAAVHENQIADLRAEATLQIQSLQDRIAELEGNNEDD